MLYERDDKGKLVPCRELPAEVVYAIESADEETIVEKLTRADYQPFFAYAYPIKTKDGVKEIIGIGVDGAKEIAMQVGNIRVEPQWKVEEKDDYIYVGVPVTNTARNVTLLGVARQCKYVLGEGWLPTDRIDELAFVKAVNKAQRNGILAVVDQVLIARIIERLDAKNIKRLEPAPKVPILPQEKEQARPEEDKLKNLRQQIHMRAKALGDDFYDSIVKPFMIKTYGVSSSVELNEEQLNEVLQFIDDNTPPTEVEKRNFAKTLKELGVTGEEFKRILEDYKAKTKRTTLLKGDFKKIIEAQKLKDQSAEADNFLKELGI